MKKSLILFVMAFLAVPTFAQVTLEQVDQLVTSGNKKEAAKAANSFFKKNKKDVNALVSLGRLYLNKQMFTEAEEVGQKALVNHSKSAALHIFLGDIRYSQEDGGAAAAEYEQAVTAEPTDTTGYMKYASIYKDKFPDQAKQMLERMGQNCPGVDVQNKIAEMYYRGNHPKEAAEAYAQCDINKLDETDLSSYVFSLSLGSKNFKKAVEVCEFAEQKYPDNVAFKRLKIYNNTDLKNYVVADSLANIFFADEKYEKNFLDYIYRGHALKGVKKYAEALESFNKALELNKDRIDVYAAIADVYSYDDKPLQSIEYYKQYLSKIDNPTSSQIVELGNYYYEAAQDCAQADPPQEELKLQYAKEADKYYMQALEKNPNFYMYHLYRGRVAMLYDKDVALDCLNKAKTLGTGKAPQNVINLIDKYIKQCTPQEEVTTAEAPEQ